MFIAHIRYGRYFILAEIDTHKYTRSNTVGPCIEHFFTVSIDLLWAMCQFLQQQNHTRFNTLSIGKKILPRWLVSPSFSIFSNFETQSLHRRCHFRFLEHLRFYRTAFCFLDQTISWIGSLGIWWLLEKQKSGSRYATASNPRDR